MTDELKECPFVREVLEVAEHLQVDNGLLTATEQYDLGEQLYVAVQAYESAKQPTPAVDDVERMKELTEKEKKDPWNVTAHEIPRKKPVPE